MKVKFLSFFILTICFSGLCFGQTEFSAAPEAQRGYLVGPGDVIAVKVLGEEQFDTTVTVDEDGNIEVPFFDKPVMAQCHSERELRTDISNLLSKYLKTPQVAVRVMERKSRPPATIYGEVRNAQQVVLTRQVTLLQLLSFSGGVTDKAGGMIQVTRTQSPICSNKEEEAKWNLETNNGLNAPSSLYSLTSIKQAKTESNPVIYPGDIVVVMKAPPVYVIGEVNAIREIFITENGLSLTEAIAQAGGFNREAQKKDITIQRIKPNSRERESITVNYDLIKKGKQKDLMLDPEDIVIINKTKKGVGETILEIITGGAKNAANILPTVIL